MNLTTVKTVRMDLLINFLVSELLQSLMWSPGLYLAQRHLELLEPSIRCFLPALGICHVLLLNTKARMQQSLTSFSGFQKFFRQKTSNVLDFSLDMAIFTKTKFCGNIVWISNIYIKLTQLSTELCGTMDWKILLKTTTQILKAWGIQQTIMKLYYYYLNFYAI